MEDGFVGGQEMNQQKIPGTLKWTVLVVLGGLMMGGEILSWAKPGNADAPAGKKSTPALHANPKVKKNPSFLHANLMKFKEDRSLLRKDYQAAKQALMEKMKSGEITQEAFVEEKEILIDAYKKDREALRASHKLEKNEIKALVKQEKEEDRKDGEEDKLEEGKAK